MFVDEKALGAAVAEVAERIKQTDLAEALPKKPLSIPVTLVIGEVTRRIPGEVPTRSPHIEDSPGYQSWARGRAGFDVPAFVATHLPHVIQQTLMFSSGMPQQRRRELEGHPIRIEFRQVAFDPARHTPPRIASERRFPGVV
ncbi:MAG: hypothetical protein HY053_08410 [Proteobacteria bacterium]|nr:hypothetical protein [Pseudomonadota bacterium]